MSQTNPDVGGGVYAKMYAASKHSHTHRQWKKDIEIEYR